MLIGNLQVLNGLVWKLAQAISPSRSFSVIYVLSLLFCLYGLREVSAQSPSPFFRFKSISVNEQLSHSDVTSIVQDDLGYIWIGTNNGLNRFDGYTLKTFKYDLDEPNAIPGNRIKALESGPFGYLWISIENKGVFRFDPQLMHFDEVDIPYPSLNITSIRKGPNGSIWLHKQDLGLIRLVLRDDGAIEKVIPYSSAAITGNSLERPVQTAFITEQVVLVLSRESDVWFFDTRQERFVQHLDRSTCGLYDNEEIVSLFQKGDTLWLGSDRGRLFTIAEGRVEDLQLIQYFPDDYDHQYSINRIIQDAGQRLWLGTNAGLYLIRSPEQSRPVMQYKHSKSGESSISSNQVNCLYEDRFGLLWVGTDGGGLDYTNLRQKPFAYIPLPASEPLSENNVVGAVYKSKRGKIWIGTRSGLYIYDPSSQSYETTSTGQLDFLNLYTVFLFEDHEGVIWIGTESDGLYRAEEIDREIRIQAWTDGEGRQPEELQNTMRITEDRLGRLWVSTYLRGLFVIDADRQHTRRIQYDALDANSLSSNKMTDVYCDPLDGSIWASTRDAGVNHITWTNEHRWQIKHYTYSATEQNSISSNHCWQIFRTAAGDLWVATLGGGINEAFLAENGELQFRRFTVKDGLTDNDIESFEEDRHGQLWLGGVGLTKLDPASGTCKQYYYQDGLQSNSFKIGASFKDEQGVLYFGGIDGINYFQPDAIRTDTMLPAVHLTGMSINDQVIETGAALNGRILLEAPLSSTRTVSLKHYENNCSISFVGLHFAAPEKNEYRYQLEGLNDNWTVTRYPNLSARYYNLPPGNYTFKLLASNGDGQWVEQMTRLHIHISPPWYWNPWAFWAYALVFILALFAFRQNTIYRTRLKNDLVMAEKEQELNQTKLQFFTQISHELRSPLTLIKIPLEELLDQPGLKAYTKNKLAIIQGSVNRLLDLVNQLLEFRKLESGNLQLQNTVGDFGKFTRDIFLLFSQSASDKGIHYQFICQEEEITLVFDPDKMEIVITNLLHNAYKFSPKDGTIQLRLSTVGSAKMAGRYQGQTLLDNYLKLEITDNGPGLDDIEKDKIFAPYYQVQRNRHQDSRTTRGTGIGLSLVKHITALHRGTVEVNSKRGYGACFSVCLPFGGSAVPQGRKQEIEKLTPKAFPDFYPEIDPDIEVFNGSAYLQQIEQLSRRYTVMIVEDNPNLRCYLQNHLEAHFAVQAAANGRAAFEIILDDPPDLIISDIMMPVMNGIQLCKLIKEHELLAHIPIILLTARAAAVHQQAGLEIGAEDYITKPFSMTYLYSKICALLQNRDHIQRFYRKQPFLEPLPDNRLSHDKELVMQVIQLVEDNLGEKQFSVEELANSLGLSKSSLYRKVKAATGKTAVELVRDVRLRRAAQLLKEDKMTICQIAYSVGFTDLKYFRKCFYKLYRVNPSKFGK